MAPCAKCGREVQDNQTHCSFDYEFHGYPNVKFAQREAPVLGERVLNVTDALQQQAGSTETVASLRSFAAETGAVVNADASFLRTFLNSDRALYATYRKQLEAGTRTPAQEEFDKERASAEALLFGTNAIIVYAALAVAGQGLTSYGHAAMRLKTEAIDARASLLDENSFTFCRKHRLPFPSGHRSTWDERADLVLAVLGEKIVAGATDDLPALLLFSEGDRQTDQFIEVHIWGEFSNAAIGRVDTFPDASNLTEEFDLLLAREAALRLGVEWIEHE